MNRMGSSSPHRLLVLLVVTLYCSICHGAPALAPHTNGKAAKRAAASACTDAPFGVVTNRGTASASAAAKAKAAALRIRGGEVQEVTTLEEANSIINQANSENKLVVIDFTASWCGPCKLIAPFYRELSDLEDVKALGIVFLKVDVDANPETAQHFNVSAMPTFVFVKGGEVVDRLMGANGEKLREMVLDLA